MNRTARTERQIVKARRAARKDSKQGLHTLASHARKCGLDADTASAVGGALRAKAKTCGIKGKAAVMVRPTADGAKLVRGAKRFSKAEFLAVAEAYAPRAARFVAARKTLLAAI